MTRMKNLRMLAALCAVVLMVSLAACQKTTPEPATDDPVGEILVNITQADFVNPIPNPFLPPDLGELTARAPTAGELKASLTELAAENADSIGWLFIPHTAVNDVVLQSRDNDYYLRRNNTKSYDWYGCYFADWRAKINADALSRNVVIYGHSMDDDPDGLKFSQLKKFLDLDYAKDNPYIYFSTPDADYMYKVFAVFYTDVKFNYIDPNPTDANFNTIINTAKARSQLLYPDVAVTTSDKIITLSTCTYVYGKQNQRFVVMGRMVGPGEPIPQTANVSQNPNPQRPNF